MLPPVWRSVRFLDGTVVKFTCLLLSQVSAGGSLSNTLLALARLGAAEHALHGRGTLRVAMDGIIGGDPLSEFYNSQMQRAGVQVLARPSPSSCTGAPSRDAVSVLRCTDEESRQQMLIKMPPRAQPSAWAMCGAVAARSSLYLFQCTCL